MSLTSPAFPRYPARLRIELLGKLRIITEPSAGSAPRIGQPRRLALLALIADSGETGISRDRILGLLWPEVSESRARHSLDQLLYALRGDLGPDTVIGNDALALDRTVISCDLWDFKDAIRRSDWSTAVAAYSGPFLDGFFAGAGEEFDQ